MLWQNPINRILGLVNQKRLGRHILDSFFIEVKPDKFLVYSAEDEVDLCNLLPSIERLLHVVIERVGFHLTCLLLLGWYDVCSDLFLLFSRVTRQDVDCDVWAQRNDENLLEIRVILLSQILTPSNSLIILCFYCSCQYNDIAIMAEESFLVLYTVDKIFINLCFLSAMMMMLVLVFIGDFFLLIFVFVIF